MDKKIIELINKYDNIVIYRHANPDLDALGSQFGLKQLILDNFKNKNVYVLGDMTRPCFLGEMDEVSDDIIKNSLSIICDVAVINMTKEQRYLNSKEIIIIDHHNNDSDINASVYLKDINAAAACQMLAAFAKRNNLYVSSKTATALYTGILTDSNRFMFTLSDELFEIGAYLVSRGADLNNIYEVLYNESLASKKMKAYFTNKIKYNGKGLAYIINNKDIYKKFDVPTFNISRGMVNVMSNVEEIQIWANFTEDRDSDKILCEFRSKKIAIIDVAKKYGGGGHELACGVTIYDKRLIKNILKDFENLLMKG